MKIPGPDHPITLSTNPKRVRVMIGDHVIADTDRALTLQEASYRPVQYFPREDVEMGFAGKTARSTNCPYKGDASYYTFDIDGGILENVAWSYETPYPAMANIAGYVAFYPDRVELYELEGPITHAAERPHGRP